jgi:hypothetical protein
MRKIGGQVVEVRTICMKIFTIMVGKAADGVGTLVIVVLVFR